MAKRETKGKAWGRRLRGSAKAGRSGPSGAKHKRKVFFEGPGQRCEKHHSYKAKCGCEK